MIDTPIPNVINLIPTTTSIPGSHLSDKYPARGIKAPVGWVALRGLNQLPMV
jgi:hypothetical protein